MESMKARVLEALISEFRLSAKTYAALVFTNGALQIVAGESDARNAIRDSAQFHSIALELADSPLSHNEIVDLRESIIAATLALEV